VHLHFFINAVQQHYTVLTRTGPWGLSLFCIIICDFYNFDDVFCKSENVRYSAKKLLRIVEVERRVSNFCRISLDALNFE